MKTPEFGEGSPDDPGVRAAALAALDLVENGACVGLGSGRAASAFIALLGTRVQHGLVVTAVATSRASSMLARAVGISLIDLGNVVELDLIVDGADEVSPNLDLVKGWGGALVQERIVASVARRQIIVVGPEKLVGVLGARGRIPVEVIPLASGAVTRKLRALGLVATVRSMNGGARALLTENGNETLDCALAEPLGDPRSARALEAAVLEIAGVVDTGLFLGTAERVLVGYPDGRVETRVRIAP